MKFEPFWMGIFKIVLVLVLVLVLRGKIFGSNFGINLRLAYYNYFEFLLGG